MYYDSAWYNKSYTLDKLGDYEDAIKCYDKAIEINANFAGAFYNRACSKVKKGDIDNGLEDLKKAIQNKIRILKPDSKDIRFTA